MRLDSTRRPTFHSTALWAAGLLVCLATLAAPGSVSAQMSSDVSDKAKHHYEHGVDLYEKGKYRRAATELRKAYSLAPSPLLLYNVAMAEWRAGDLESALATAYRVLEDGLKGKMQPTLQGRVRGFERILRARRLVETVEPAPRTPPSEHAVADGSGGFSTAGWLAIASGSAGAVALFGALSIDRQIASDVGAFERAARRGDASSYRRRIRDLQKRQTLGRVLLGSGATLMATATGLLLVELIDGSGGSGTSATAASPLRSSITPADGGLPGTLSVSFGD